MTATLEVMAEMQAMRQSKKLRREPRVKEGMHCITPHDWEVKQATGPASLLSSLCIHTGLYSSGTHFYQRSDLVFTT